MGKSRQNRETAIYEQIEINMKEIETGINSDEQTNVDVKIEIDVDRE